MFFNNKNIPYDDTELKRKISNIELDIEKLKGHVNSVRGLVNRQRAKGLDDEEEEEQENPQDKVLTKTYK